MSLTAGPESSSALPALTVVLVNFHSFKGIETILRSAILDGHDVIVVDNGDDPAAVESLCASVGATALLLDRNVGFAAAVNRAVGSVKHPDRPWLLLNPDVEIDRSQLDALSVRLAQGPDGVAPLLAAADGRLQVGAAGGPVTLRAVAAYFLFLSHLVPRLRGVFLTRSQSARAREVDWLCMACLLVSPDAFDRFGPIPEDELVYAEDVSWGTAASARGARFELVPEIVVRHDQGSSGGSARWIGALERLCRARLGAVRGTAAVATIRIGLAVRRIAGRPVT